MLPGYSFRDPTVGTASYIAYLHLCKVKHVYETSFKMKFLSLHNIQVTLDPSGLGR